MQIELTKTQIDQVRQGLIDEQAKLTDRNGVLLCMVSDIIRCLPQEGSLKFSRREEGIDVEIAVNHESFVEPLASSWSMMVEHLNDRELVSVLNQKLAYLEHHLPDRK